MKRELGNGKRRGERRRGRKGKGLSRRKITPMVNLTGSKWNEWGKREGRVGIGGMGVES